MWKPRVEWQHDEGPFRSWYFGIVLWNFTISKGISLCFGRAVLSLEFAWEETDEK